MKTAPNRFLLGAGACLALMLRPKSRWLLWKSGIAVGLLLAVLPVPAWCQLTLPEFFGFYAADGGRTIAVYEGRGSAVTAKISQELFSVPSKGPQSYTIPVVSPSVRFILFYSNAGEMIKAMTFHRLPLVRNVVEMPDLSQRSTGVTPRVIGTPNKSLLARIPELESRILTKPVPNQLQMVELVPDTTLVPGLYVFDYNPGHNQGWYAVVSIRSTSEQEKPYCLDLMLPGGYGGLFESANSELNDAVPALGSYRYKRCDSSAASNTPAPPSVNRSAGAPTSDPVSNPPVAPPPNPVPGPVPGNSVPGSTPTTTAGAVAIKPPMPPRTCRQSSYAGYVLILQNHSYSVRTIGSGAARSYVFFDENGVQVTDPGVLQQLASAVWTRDNVVASQDARSGQTRVSGILGTSQAMLKYTVAQDLLSYAMVDAIEAAVTDGASLTQTVAGITLGAAKSQMTDAPKIVLTLAAQHGLEATVNIYRSTEVLLPPKEATTLNTADLARARDLYFQARSLELVFGALAAKLMPVTASDLTNEALQSAFSALADGPLFSGAPSEKVTLQRLLDLQAGIANLNTSLPGLDRYSENLKLALNLTKANRQTISAMAATAEKKCN
jgi:hypothetical protein